MPPRLRLLWAAGAIAVIVLLAQSRSRPFARLDVSLSAKAIPPGAPILQAPLDSISIPSELGRGVAQRTELLRSGSFAELLSSTLEIDDKAEQAHWLATCARLASPRLLAEHALKMPLGPTRDSLLEQAVDRWVIDSPVEAGTWIAAHVDDDHAVDFVLARIIEHTDTVQRSTSSALSWVALIRDPALRFHALQAVLREWADSDPDAAFRFAETTPGLSPAEHDSLLGLFISSVTET